ncbi:PucR family transcriptional regulator [Peribacillus muralis]|uniref:PucR family transcriptional regulator n=1 Tax=Peribacillus muralis TaxID=264697 RepID=UPI00070B386B|nr:helix-turn-helix domain-containing protein [Peribacillus muralis]
MMKEQAVFEAQQRLKGEFIEIHFSGKMDDSLKRKAKHLQIDESRDYMVVNINIKGSGHDEKKRHLAEIANKVCREENKNGLIVTKHNQIIMLFSFDSKSTLSYSNAKVESVINLFLAELTFKKWDISVSFGIGRLKSGLANAYKSAQEASKCLQFIQGHNLRTNVLKYSVLGIHRLLLQSSEEELKDFIQETLGPLIKYDRTKKGDLLHTLIKYLENNQKGTDTAKILHLHINTLNYRLRRIEEILSMHLSDTEKFLNLQLTIKMYHYMKFQ